MSGKLVGLVGSLVRSDHLRLPLLLRPLLGRGNEYPIEPVSQPFNGLRVVRSNTLGGLEIRVCIVFNSLREACFFFDCQRSANGTPPVSETF